MTTILDFLSQFVYKANIQAMRETQALIELSSIMRGFVRSQYEAEGDLLFSEKDGFTRWPEAVQYLLMSYA